LLVGQAKNNDSPFEITDMSVKEELTSDWKEKIRARIKKVDQVVVICGENTNTASGVAVEVKITQEEEKPYFLLWGRSDKTCVKPKTTKESDKFRYNRKLLGRLSRCACETVKEMMQAVIEDNTVVPGMIVAVQTFGSSDIHWHPHLHCLVTNGCFDKDGTFHPMEILLPSAIIEVFQHKVFRMLLKEGLITQDRIKMILSWRHTGFHVHNKGKVVANDMASPIIRRSAGQHGQD